MINNVQTTIDWSRRLYHFVVQLFELARPAVWRLSTLDECRLKHNEDIDDEEFEIVDRPQGNKTLCFHNQGVVTTQPPAISLVNPSKR